MATGRERRYQWGEQPVYDRKYETLKMMSAVLNPVKREKIGGPRGGDGTAEAADLRRKLNVLDGMDGLDDKYFDPSFSGQYQICNRVQAETNLALAEEALKRSRQNAVYNGQARTFADAKGTPGDRDRVLLCEATLDIVGEEIDWLRTRIRALEAPLKAKHDAQMLLYGPQGSGTGLNSVDGQTIARLQDGRPYIDDPRSPFNRMLLVDYRQHVAHPYLKGLTGKGVLARCQPCAREKLPAWPQGILTVDAIVALEQPRETKTTAPVKEERKKPMQRKRTTKKARVTAR